MATAKYHPLMKALHWAMALVIIGLIAVGWYMAGLDKEDPLRPTLYFFHKSFGFLTFLLIGLRVVLRFTTPIPSLPESIPLQERRLAQAGHGLLYLLMAVVIFSGVYMSMAGGHGISFFGLPVPNFLAEHKPSAMIAHSIHVLLPYVLLGLVALHVLGALKHRFFDKNPENDVLKRMI